MVIPDSLRSAARRAATGFSVFTAGDPVVGAVAFLLAAYYFAVPGIFQGKASGDGFFGFMYLPGVLVHHTLDLKVPAPEWAAILGRTKTGLVANRCPIGPALIWTPTYLIGLGVQKVFAAARSGPGAFGRREFDFFMACIGSLVLLLAANARLFVFLRRRVSVAAARLGVIVAALATPITWYTVVQPAYQHACSYAMVVFFIERWDAWRGAMTTRRWIALGALGGGAALMRPQEALFLLLPAIDIVVGAVGALQGGRRQELLGWVAGGAACAAAALLVELPQLVVFQIYYGTMRPVQDPSYFLTWNPAIVEALFSMRAGIFPWVPSVYLALIGFALARGKARVGLGLLVVALLQFWLNAAVWDFHGCFSFGPRRYCDLVPLCALGVALLFDRVPAGWGRRVVVACALVTVVHNLVLTEGMRTRKIKSAGAGAFRASVWNEWIGGPRWLGRALDTVGYPFAQPAGWIFALVNRAPVTAFEDIVGDYLFERDWHVHSVHSNDAIVLADDSGYVVSGVLRRDKRASADGQPIRVLLPLMVSEPVRLHLRGELSDQQALVARWNGEVRPILRSGDDVVINVDAAAVHDRARVNELVIEGVRAGTALTSLTVELFTTWWKNPRSGP